MKPRIQFVLEEKSVEDEDEAHGNGSVKHSVYVLDKSPDEHEPGE
jgi:hypothetical protein